jgi:hypothetical protein
MGEGAEGGWGLAMKNLLAEQLARRFSISEYTPHENRYF